MWPRSRERGNRWRRRCSFPRARMLQCGRAHVSAETVDMSQEGELLGTAASMWPRSRERGNDGAYQQEPEGARESFNVAALT